VPSLLVDTGYFLSDERGTHGKLRPDVTTKNDWTLKAYSQFAVDVVNVSSHDLRYFASLLTKSDSARRAEREPALGKLISANIVAESPHVEGLHPFIVREVPSRQNGAKPVRVAFVGLSETTPAPPKGLKIIDPAEAARRTVAEVRKNASLVVVLAKLTSEEAARVAREAPGIDVIIAGNSIGLEESFTPPFYAGQTLIVLTPFETRMLGELRFYRNAEGRFSTRQRFITLDEVLVPEDPEAKQLVGSAINAEISARSNSKMLLDNWLASSRPRESGLSGSESSPALVGSAACTKCHAVQYGKWANSGHAHATDSLATRPLEFEASCLDCHATGSKLASAANKSEPAKLQNVQCEQCHGPGSAHVAKPGKGYGRIANLQKVCASCHDSETSPGFDVQTALEKIKH